MTRTLIYARVSTEDQLEKYGLPLQLRACREYAEKAGYSVIAEITDDGISGTILDRPGLDRVRRMVADGEADIVLMVDVDRLSRELIHLLILKPEVERKARLEFVNAKFEDSPSGRMFFGMRGVFAQYEREQMRERTMRGMKERARAGLVVGGRTAYGYNYEDGKLVADVQRAPIVRDIYAWYDAGESMRSIALRLRKIAAPTWSGKQWGHSSVQRILINETYAGIAHYGAHRRTGKTLRLRDAGERIAVSVPALIAREQWERVQARIAENPMRGAITRNYLLRGLLHCTCGRRMSGNCRRKHLSYRCSGRDVLRFHGGVCRTSVNARQLDAAVWRAVSQAFTDGVFLRSILSDHQGELQGAGPERAGLLAAQATKLRRREEACLSALLDADLADAHGSIKAEYRKAQAERKRLEAEHVGIAASQRAVQSAGAWLDETVELLREYIPKLRTMEERQVFLRAAVQRAEWSGEEVRIECLIRSELSITSARCEQFEPLKLILKARLAA